MEVPQLLSTAEQDVDLLLQELDEVDAPNKDDEGIELDDLTQQFLSEMSQVWIVVNFVYMFKFSFNFFQKLLEAPELHWNNAEMFHLCLNKGGWKF